MARARVTLREAISYTKRGRTFKRGVPQIVDKQNEIDYFKATSGFAVTLLPEQPPKQRVVEPPSETEDAPETTEEPETEPETKTAKRGLRRRGKKG